MVDAVLRARFCPSGPFHADLKARVEEYFRRSGRSPHGGWAMRLKTALMVAWLAASYLSLLLGNPSPWQASLLAISLGLAIAGVGFDVMHDANHGSYSRSSGVNRALGYTLDLIGGSSYLWRHKHNVLHHTYPNVSGLDADLEPGPFLRFARAQPRRRYHRFQHLYVWVLYGLLPLRWWLLDDFCDLATGRIAGNRYPRPRAGALAATLCGKALFFGWAFALPAVFHPTWAIVPIGLLVVFTLGITISVVFQLAHCVGEAEFHGIAEQGIGSDWAVLQVNSTVDFARGNRILSWYLGGLNFQVEHHLFPRVCHFHYPALSSIVEAACRDHGLRYRVQPSFGAAVAANVRWLARLGRADEGGAGGPPATTAAASVDRIRHRLAPDH